MDKSEEERIVLLLQPVMTDDSPQFIGAPKIPNGTGLAVKNARIDYLIKYKLISSDKINIIGMAFDTTSSNTGNIKGAATLFEKGFNRTFFMARL